MLCNTVTTASVKGKDTRTHLDREQVLAAASKLVKQQGPQSLTMRKLAAELGTAVTSIYWHVGNRESLLEALVERTVADLGEIRPAAPHRRRVSSPSPAPCAGSCATIPTSSRWSTNAA